MNNNQTEDESFGSTPDNVLLDQNYVPPGLSHEPSRASVRDLNEQIETLQSNSAIQTGNYAMLKDENDALVAEIARLNLAAILTEKRSGKLPIAPKATLDQNLEGTDPIVKKAIFAAITQLEDNATKSDIEIFLKRVESLIEFCDPKLNSAQSLALTRTKMCDETLDDMDKVEPQILTYEEFKDWIKTRRALSIDSDVAKRELLSQTQITSKLDVRAYFRLLQKIAKRIDYHKGLNHEIQEAFVNSLDPRIRMEARKAFDMHQAHCSRVKEPVTDEWVVQTAVILDMHTPKATPTTPIVNTVTRPISGSATTTVPQEFRKGPLTESGKTWLLKNGGCFFCRELGHMIRDCARLAKFKAENPGKVRTFLPPSKPIVKSFLDDSSLVGEGNKNVSTESTLSYAAAAKGISTRPLSVHFSPDEPDYFEDCAVIVEDESLPPVVTFNCSQNIPEATSKPLTSSFDDCSLVVEDEHMPPFIQPYYTDSPLLDRIDDSRPWKPHASQLATPPETVNEADTDDHDTWPVWSGPGNRMLFSGTVSQGKSDASTVPFSVNANILADTGCDGLCMSEEFARAHNLPLIPVAPKGVRMADDSEVLFANQCTVRVRVNRFCKELTFAVGPIAEDVIFGLPFFSGIIIRNADWANHRFSFISSSGTLHQWYGTGHNLCKNGISPVRLCSLRELERIKNGSDVFRVNVNQVLEELAGNQ